MTEKQSKPKKLYKRISPDYLRNSGLYYLQRFAASERGFRRVMERKIMKSCHDHPEQDQKYCLSLLDTLVADFVRLGYINDQSYALGLVRSLRGRGWPKSRIERKLNEHGMTDEIVEIALADEENITSDFDQALLFLKKKKRGFFRTSPDPELYQKDLAALARAGFSYEVAQRALKTKPNEIL